MKAAAARGAMAAPGGRPSVRVRDDYAVMGHPVAHFVVAVLQHQAGLRGFADVCHRWFGRVRSGSGAICKRHYGASAGMSSRRRARCARVMR